jgi:hypothetical protein
MCCISSAQEDLRQTQPRQHFKDWGECASDRNDEFLSEPMAQMSDETTATPNANCAVDSCLMTLCSEIGSHATGSGTRTKHSSPQQDAGQRHQDGLVQLRLCHSKSVAIQK